MSKNKIVASQSKISSTVKLVVISIALLPVIAFAAAGDPTPPDVTKVVTYIGLAVAACVAIGSAKMLPAAAMWLYSSLTSMVKRG